MTAPKPTMIPVAVQSDPFAGTPSYAMRLPIDHTNLRAIFPATVRVELGEYFLSTPEGAIIWRFPKSIEIEIPGKSATRVEFQCVIVARTHEAKG